jgi:hypothetical protein
MPDLADGNPYPLGQSTRATTLLRSPLWNHRHVWSNELHYWVLVRISVT